MKGDRTTQPCDDGGEGPAPVLSGGTAIGRRTCLRVARRSASIAGLIGVRGVIVALVLIAVGAFGGWVWEQFRDGGSISAVTYAGGGYDGSHWVGHVHNYEERTATVTCQLRRSVRKEMSSALSR